MLAVLVRKELLSNLLTFRLAVALLFTVFLATLTTLIGSLDYSRNIDAYEREVRKAREALDDVSVYSALEPVVVVPPQPISILCRGILSTAGRTMRVELDRIQIASWPLQESFESAIMKSLAQIDFATVVGLLLSFLAIVLGFDGISSEREGGTLRQILTNPVPRTHIVLAKLLGGTLSLCIPLAIAFGISLLIVQANPDVDLGSDDWLRLFLLFVLSCLFLAQAFSLSLMVSALARNSDTSLIICLFGWLVCGVGYLNVVPSLSRYLVYEPPYQVFQDQSARLYTEYDRLMADWDRRHPSPGEAYLAGLERDGRIRYGHEAGYEWRQRRHAFSVDKLLELADAGYRYRWANQEPLARQAYIVDEWSLLSPIANYQVLSYYLARTTLDDSFFLGKAGRTYRQAVIAYLRGKNASSSRRWFSDDPPDQEPMVAAPEAVTADMLVADSPFMKERMAWVEEQEAEAADDARRRLDLSDLPRFGGQWQRSLPATFAQMTPGLAMLILILGSSIVITLRRFDRYDPTGGGQAPAQVSPRERPFRERRRGRLARSAVRAVFVRELQDNLKSLRFQVSLLILLLFFIANGLVYGLKIERTDQESSRLRAVDGQRYDSAQTVRDVADRWYRIQSDPVGTEFIAEGGFNWSYTGQWVNPSSGRTLWTTLTRTTNNWMRRFEVVDWVVIGRYALSFLCIVLAYNAVSGERENGTLLLALANPVARAEFLIAKFLAHFVVLETITVLGCALSLAVLVGTGVLEFNAQIAGGCGLFLLCSSLLAALFLLLAIGISAIASTSASALVFLISTWTVLIVVVPQSSYLIALRQVDSVGPYWEELDAVRETFEESVQRDGLTPRDAARARLDEYDVERRYAERLAAMEQELDAVRKRVDRQMFEQYEVAQAVNLLSPGYAFQYSVEAVLGTGLQRTQSFLRQGWRYRDALRDFIRSRDAVDPDSPHLLYLPAFLSSRAIDATLIPRFRDTPIPAAYSLAAGVFPIALLVLETCAAFFFALWAFNRTDFSG